MKTTAPTQFGWFTGWLSRRIQARIAPIPETLDEIEQSRWFKHIYFFWRLITALPFCVMLAILRIRVSPNSSS